MFPDENHAWMAALLLMVATIVAAIPHMNIASDLAGIRGLAHVMRDSAGDEAEVPLGIM